MTQLPDLAAYLSSQPDNHAVLDTVRALATACARISRLVSAGAIESSLGLAGSENVQGEDQKALDVISNDIVREGLLACAAVSGLASEELDTVEATGHPGKTLVAFDPLDGSSNIDVNVSVGTIFSILPAPDGRAPTEEDFLQPGRRQLGAGYAVYGPQTMLVLALSGGPVGFTLAADGVWRLTHETVSIPADTKEFAINMSNQRHWAEPVQDYIAACLAGKTGPRGKDFNMRWVGSMVADVHRILMRGGVFLYPWDKREPDRAGKLRLLYEGSPMAWVVEKAGGAATDGTTRMLDVQPTKLHQRVAVVLGSRTEVGLATAPAMAERVA
jgi:fructose-1,6-bisphosphatase I